MDQANMVNPRLTIQTAYAALSGAQSEPAPQQLIAYAILFNEACNVLRLDVSEMLDKARRCARIAEDHYSIEIHALREFLRQGLN
jgi:hypothetical protein